MSQSRALADKQWEFFFFLFSTLSKHMDWSLFSQLCRHYQSWHSSLSMLFHACRFCLSVSVTWPLSLISGKFEGVLSDTLREAEASGYTLNSKKSGVRKFWVWPEAKALNLSEHHHHFPGPWSGSNYSYLTVLFWSLHMWISYRKVFCKL